jgi:Xaa-Pro aminopeptidase
LNIVAIQEALKEEGLDGWLFYDHHHRDPLAYRILGLPADLSPTRRWYYYVPATGEPLKLLHKIEPHWLDSLPGTSRFYSQWKEQTAEVQALLGSARRVAMQHSPECTIPYVAMVDAGTIDRIRASGIEVISSANLVQLFEARWTEAQLESHLEAGRRIDAIRQAAFDRIGADLNASREPDEWAICSFILEQFRRQSLFTDHGPDVSVNENASDPHYQPTAERSRRIQRGDFVLIDMWAKINEQGAVYYDITWTGYCGSAPTDEMQNVFAVVSGARDKAIHLVRDSVAVQRTLHGYEVDDAARSHIGAAGFGDRFIHRTGHSIGEDVHGSGANMDNFETHDDRRIIPGTCFSIEPGVYLPNFGIRSEVNVYVDQSEARVTGEIQRSLVRIGG